MRNAMGGALAFAIAFSKYSLRRGRTPPRNERWDRSAGLRDWGIGETGAKRPASYRPPEAGFTSCDAVTREEILISS